MDQNVLSPEQKRTLQVFQYNNINNIQDDKLSQANQDLEPVLAYMKTQNNVLQKNANTLQSLLDSVIPDPSTGNDMLLEEIRWNTYFYKKYRYQTQIMGIIIAICILLNLFNRAIPRPYFIAGSGFILSVSFVYIIYLLWDLMYRDTLNFDEYSFYNYRGQYVKSNDHTNTVDASNCALNKIVDYYA
jgi:hypothetical protein